MGGYGLLGRRRTFRILFLQHRKMDSLPGSLLLIVSSHRLEEGEGFNV